MNVESKQPVAKPFKLDWKKIGIFVVVLAIAGYQYLQQNKGNDGDKNVAKQNVVENGDGGGAGTLTVPDKIDLNFKKSKGGKKSNSGGRTSTPKSSKPYLANGKRGAKVSPAGLIYTRSRGEHRTEHVLHHAKDNPSRSGSHGVFDANGDDVFRLIDEAYTLVKKNSSQVKKERPRKGEEFKTGYVIDMKRKIGYLGGTRGKRLGNPKLQKVKLILADDRVITAYPF